MSGNPFSMIHDAIWELLERRTEFSDLVRHGNRIKYTSDTNRDPEKREVASADVPEVRILPTAWQPHLQRTSNSSTGWIEFSIQLASGDWRANKFILPVMWAVWRAMSNWKSVIGNKTWNNEGFVIHLRPNDAAVGVSDINLDRGINGWSTIWSCRVELVFATADLQQEAS